MSRSNAELRKAVRRAWMKYTMRSVGRNDDYERLDLAYELRDPWNMESRLEQARFVATNALAARAFGRVGTPLEVGCGEGYQTRVLGALDDEVYGFSTERSVARGEG